MANEERFAGAMVGLAVGDALGAAVEFARKASFAPVTGMRGGGPHHLAPGQWTDDTSMALCMAESLIERAGFDPADQMRLYVRWWKEGHNSPTGDCFDIGNTVRDALARFVISGDPFSGPSDPLTAGNGGLMRLAPVVLYYCRNAEMAIEIAGESTRTTHGAPEAIDASRYFAGLLVGALTGVQKTELLSPGYSPIRAATGDFRAPDFRGRIADVAAGSWRRKNATTLSASGYVVDTLEAAIWAFATSESFEEGALAAVNLGGDADTTGAVFGQLAGAYYGLDGIPEEWRAEVYRGRDLVVVGERLAGGEGRLGPRAER